VPIVTQLQYVVTCHFSCNPRLTSSKLGGVVITDSVPEETADVVCKEIDDMVGVTENEADTDKAESDNAEAGSEAVRGTKVVDNTGVMRD